MGVPQPGRGVRGLPGGFHVGCRMSRMLGRSGLNRLRKNSSLGMSGLQPGHTRKRQRDASYSTKVKRLDRQAALKFRKPGDYFPPGSRFVE
jgi:hypothetical protein